MLNESTAQTGVIWFCCHCGGERVFSGIAWPYTPSIFLHRCPKNL